MLKVKLVILVCLSAILFGCDSGSSSSAGSAEQPEYTKLFNISSYNLTTGDKIQLDYNTVSGAAVSFVSNDLTVASVTETGIVSAHKQGSAVIEMTLTVNGKMQKDTCTVNVTDKDITFISYQKESVILGINETIIPALTILPENTAGSNIVYQISNTSIADVDKNGAVTGKKAGETVLTAVYKSLKTSIKVVVKTDTVKVESISLNCTNISLYQGETYSLEAAVTPPNATNKNVIYSSKNRDIAIVFPNGIITAQNPGTAEITAETEEGKKQATCSVTVKEASAQLEHISIDDIVLENGTSKLVQVKVTPENAKFTNLKVKSSNDAVTITNEGRTLLLAAAKKQGYVSNIEVEAENCEPALNADCFTVFNVFTYDNNTAALPEYLELVEPYNLLMPDGENFKVYMSNYNGDKFNPLAAVNFMPLNSIINTEDIAINTPKIGEYDNILYYNKDDGLIYSQGVGEGIVQIEVLGHSEIKPVNIYVKIVSEESMIPETQKICPATSIYFTNESELLYNLTVGGRPVLVNAGVNHQTGCLGIKVETYKIETNDKNIIDIIDGYAYAKKAGKARITVTSNSVYTSDSKPVQAYLDIEVK